MYLNSSDLRLVRGWEKTHRRKLGDHDAVANHPRLLRSLHWGDDDYGGHLFNVFGELVGRNLQNLQTIEEFVGLEDWLKRKDNSLYEEPYGGDEHDSVVSLDQV
jgi:hypothetical protein